MAQILIETKEVEENGVIYIIETYKSDITGKESVVEYPKPSDEPVEPVEPEPSQLDRMEEKLDTLVSGTTNENTEAINALLGVE